MRKEKMHSAEKVATIINENIHKAMNELPDEYITKYNIIQKRARSCDIGKDKDFQNILYSTVI